MKDEKQETYQFKVDCDNCREYVAVYIPKGTQAIRFINTAKCPNCGCDVKNTKLVFIEYSL